MDSQLPQKHQSEPTEENKLLKRARIDPKSNTVYTASPVLFIRGLSPRSTEKDLVELCAQAGVIVQLFMLHNKGQAFVEFDSEEAAEFCLLHFSKSPAFLDSNRLHFSYSGREQITRKPHEAPSPTKELILNITQTRFHLTQEVLAKITSPYGRLVHSRIFPRDFGFQCVIEMDTLEGAKAARAGLDGQHIYSGCNAIKAEYSPMPLLIQNINNEEDTSNVVFLHNMADNVTPDMLFNLFSVYGNVTRVKIFYKKREMGLVQFEEHSQALDAKNNLNNVPLCGTLLMVSISRNSFISMPENDEKKAFCKDFTHSTFHRYKIAGSKNFQNIFPPSNVLHLSNLSAQMDEEFFRRLFADSATLLGFKYIGEGRRMALAKCKDVADAVMVLVNHHNENIAGRFLKIAFSKANF